MLDNKLIESALQLTGKTMEDISYPVYWKNGVTNLKLKDDFYNQEPLKELLSKIGT